jgi:hypothetical protein
MGGTAIPGCAYFQASMAMPLLIAMVKRIRVMIRGLWIESVGERLFCSWSFHEYRCGSGKNRAAGKTAAVQAF